MAVRSVRILAGAAVAASMLSGCAGVGPGLKGNDTGGIISWANVTHAEAGQMAADHCARYGKFARPTGVDARYGGYYSFSCVPHPRFRR